MHVRFICNGLTAMAALFLNHTTEEGPLIIKVGVLNHKQKTLAFHLDLLKGKRALEFLISCKRQATR